MTNLNKELMQKLDDAEIGAVEWENLAKKRLMTNLGQGTMIEQLREKN